MSNEKSGEFRPDIIRIDEQVCGFLFLTLLTVHACPSKTTSPNPKGLAR